MWILIRKDCLFLYLSPFSPRARPISGLLPVVAGLQTALSRLACSCNGARRVTAKRSMAAAAAAASTAANTEARRSGSAPRSWRHRQATLLACSETRSEREIEDLEAAEVNTANTKTAAASIAMHRFTGTFADRSHESAYAARIFRMSFPYHAFLLALVLAAAIWVVHQAPDR